MKQHLTNKKLNRAGLTMYSSCFVVSIVSSIPAVKAQSKTLDSILLLRLPVLAAGWLPSLSMVLFAGQSPTIEVMEHTSDSYTASVQLPAGCHISDLIPGPLRPDAAAAEAAAAWECLKQLQGPGHLVGYWSSAALLQQAGVEGGGDGGEAGKEAVLWRCEVCGVPATSARNLEV